MSIQPSTLVTAKTDYAGLKDSISASIERSLLEKIDSSQGLEKPVQPKFMEVLDNKHEVQPKILSKKDVHAKKSKSNETLDFKSSKDNHSFSSNSLVKSKENTIETVNKTSDYTLKEGQKLDSQSEDAAEIATEDRHDEKDVIQTTISLASSFLQDTLQEINLKQNRSWKSSIEGELSLDQFEASELLEKMPTDSIQIEMLSPLKEGSFSLDDDQMKHMTDLLSTQTEILEGDELPKENGSTTVSASKPEEPKNIIEMTLLEAITEGRNIKEERASSHTKDTSSLREMQAQLSPHNIDKIIPIAETQTNFGSMSSGFSGAPLNNGLIGIGAVSLQSSVGAKAGFGVEGSMAQTKLDQLNALMQVKDHFKAMLNNKESHLKVILTPEELGTVEITLDILRDTVVSTFIKAERRDTMELLSRHAEEIDMLFKNAGLQSDLTNMNFSSNQQEYIDQENAARKQYAEKSAEEVASDLLPLEADMIDSDTLINIKA